MPMASGKVTPLRTIRTAARRREENSTCLDEQAWSCRAIRRESVLPMLTDDANRGRLLSESSMRAFAGLRSRAMESLARIRAIALAAFGAVGIVFALAGDSESRTQLWPLLAYAVTGYLLLRWRRGGGWREQITVSSPMFDVVFIFLLLWSIGPRAPGQPFNVGWTLGAFALLIGLSALSLRVHVITATAALAFALFTALQLRMGAHWANVAMGGVVLALVAMVAAAVVAELERVVARLVVNEVSHEELRRAQSEAETLTHLLVHDMKGPLTGLIGLAEVVASELTGPLHSDVKMIEQQGRRLQAMVGDLLAIARLERGVLSSAPETIDLSALLVSLANAYAISARRAGAQITACVVAPGDGAPGLRQPDLERARLRAPRGPHRGRRLAGSP